MHGRKCRQRGWQGRKFFKVIHTKLPIFLELCKVSGTLFLLGAFFSFLDMILTDEWTEKLANNENIVKDLQKKYTEKCKALEVRFLVL